MKLEEGKVSENTESMGQGVEGLGHEELCG